MYNPKREFFFPELVRICVRTKRFIYNKHHITSFYRCFKQWISVNKYENSKSIIPFFFRPNQKEMTTKTLPKLHQQMRHEMTFSAHKSRNICLWKPRRTSLHPQLFQLFSHTRMVWWLRHILVVISNAPSVSSSMSSMSLSDFDVVPFSFAVWLSTWFNCRCSSCGSWEFFSAQSGKQ